MPRRCGPRQQHTWYQLQRAAWYIGWTEFFTRVLLLLPADATAQSQPATCENDQMQQQETGSSSLLQLGMNQSRFVPKAREVDSLLLAWLEPAGSIMADSMFLLPGQSLSTSMAPKGSGRGSGSNSSSTAYGMNKELPSWDWGRSAYVKAQALWRHVNSVFLSIRRFRVHHGSSSSGLWIDIACAVALVFAGFALFVFVFCVLAQDSDELPSLQFGGVQKVVRERSAGTAWTGPDDLATATQEQRSVVSSPSAPLALRKPSPTSWEAVGLRSPSVTSALQFPVNTQQSGVGLLDALPDLGQRPASTLVLCEGLVVPVGSECALLVPKIRPTYAKHQAIVNDLANIPIFSVAFCQPAFPTAVPAGNDCDADQCLALCTDDGALLAYCRSNINNTLSILNKDDVLFGLARMCTGQLAGSFEIITQEGIDLHLSENRFGDVIISDRHGQIIALTEPHHPRPELRRLRVGPNCDAGLATLSLLVIELLKALG